MDYFFLWYSEPNKIEHMVKPITRVAKETRIHLHCINHDVKIAMNHTYFEESQEIWGLMCLGQCGSASSGLGKQKETTGRRKNVVCQTIYYPSCSMVRLMRPQFVTSLVLRAAVL